MLGVTFVAKLAKSAFEIFLEFAGIVVITRFIHHFFGLSRLEFSLVLFVVFVVLGIVIYKVDWESFVAGANRLFGREPTRA